MYLNRSELQLEHTVKTRLLILIVLILHLVGVIGFASPYRDLFSNLTPLHLIITATMLLLGQRKFDYYVLYYVAVSFWIGFAAEVIGVNKGWLFGNYVYGETLGIKWLNVPLMIGVNWFVLVYCTGIFMDRFAIPDIVKAVVGAVILVGIDAIIEPVAIQLDFWHWYGEAIPITNYIGWFFVGWIQLIVFYMFPFKKTNALALPILLVQIAFFVILNIMLGWLQ